MSNENWNGPGVLEIGWEDLDSPETLDGVNRLREAQNVPLVREVGTPTAKPRWYNGPVVQAGLAGLVGGLVTWGLAEILQANESLSATAGNILSTMAFAVGIGVVMVMWDAITARSAAKFGHDIVRKAPIMIGIAALAGVVINWIYQAWIEAIFNRLLEQGTAAGWSADQFLDALTNASHLPRGVAWALMGMAVGAGIGVAYRRRERIINGLIGGAAGGFIAGFMFDYFPGGVEARAFGILFTGLAIGLAIGLVEKVRSQHFLEIQSGGMAGKQFILYSGNTTVGSAPFCDVTLIKDPGIAPVHMTLTAKADGLHVEAASGAALAINNRPVTQQQLRDGDEIALGATLLRYRAKSDVAVPTGPIVG